MQIPITALVLALQGFLLGSTAAQTIPRALLSSPARLELDKSTIEVKRGTTVTYTVTLKNAENQVIAAPEDIKMNAETPSGIQDLVMRRGSASVGFLWLAKKEGLARIVVRSGKLAPASCLTVVTPFSQAAAMEPVHSRVEAADKPASPITSVTRPRAVEAPRRQPSRTLESSTAMRAPVAATPSPQEATPSSQPSKLQVFVQPEPLFEDAHSGSWNAKVAVAAEGEHGELFVVPSNFPVHLVASRGHLSSPDVIIPGGQSSTFNSPVDLVSRQAGEDTLQALSSLSPAQSPITYLPALPTKLGLSVGTPEFSYDGSSIVRSYVCLHDDANNLAHAPQGGTAVNVVSTLGRVGNPVVQIAEYCSQEVDVTSQSAGFAIIRATSEGGLRADEVKIEFPRFPWYLVWLAALGGLIGATVAAWQEMFSHNWWSHTWRNLILGAGLGMILYLFARYSAFVLPSDLPIKLQNIPTVTRIGALLIGIVGGLFGRRLWKVDTGQEAGAAPAAARHAAGQ